MLMEAERRAVVHYGRAMVAVGLTTGTGGNLSCCAREEGLLLCPEGAATLAAYEKALAEGLVKPGERAVLYNCATGLKYPMPETRKTLDRSKPIDFGRFGGTLGA